LYVADTKAHFAQLSKYYKWLIVVGVLSMSVFKFLQ